MNAVTNTESWEAIRDVANVEGTEAMMEALIQHIDEQGYSRFPAHLNVALVGAILVNMCDPRFTKKDYQELAALFAQQARECNT